MFYNYYQSDEYDSCMAKGVCSSMPVTNSLQEVVIIYLKNIAYYILKLQELGVSNSSIQETFLNIFSGLISGSDYIEDDYENILYTLYEIYLNSKQTYKKFSINQNIAPKDLQTNIKLSKTHDINKIIQFGEREFEKRMKKFNAELKNLLELSFFVAKSICVNMLELNSFGYDIEESYTILLKIFNLMNENTVLEDDIINLLNQSVELNYKLHKEIHELYRKNYGEPEPTMVSFSTRPNKAILVTGRALKELELLLEATRDKNIDVYTHGVMISALTYPKFKEYPHLIGHFGVGTENCLLDFATFPGAILMTRLSLQNLDYLYRGRIFTTDITAPKGVVKISDNDFSKVIKAAQVAKGFKKGQEREAMPVGYFRENILKRVDTIIEDIKNKHVDNIILVGNCHKNPALTKYFEKLIELAPESSAIISLDSNEQKKSIFQMNICYDFTLIYEILEKFSQAFELKDLNFSIFITTCELHTISNILNLKDLGIKNVFMSFCSPKLINPSVLTTLKDVFKIHSITNPKQDMSYILNS